MSFPGRGQVIVQRKKTIYPEWNTCFDAHLYPGRVIEFVVKQRPDTLVADISIPAQGLAAKCIERVATVWVRFFSSRSIGVLFEPFLQIGYFNHIHTASCS